MLNSGTTNDIYSPLAESKYSRRMDERGGDAERLMRTRGSGDSNAARDAYQEQRPHGPAGGRQSAGRNDRKASLGSESSYAGRRGSALRSRGNSVDRAKKDGVWKNGSRSRMMSDSRNKSGGDFSQRSNGSRRSQKFSKLSHHSKDRSR